MHHRRVLGVDDLGALLLGCRDHAGVAVTGAGDTDAGGEVEVVVAVGAMNPRALRMIDDDGRRLFECGAQRGGLGCLHGFGGGGHAYTVTVDRRIVNN